MKQIQKLSHVLLSTLFIILFSSTITFAATNHYTSNQVPGNWVQSGDNYYWQKSSGGNLTNAFLDYKNNTYYLNSNGIMAKGWRQIDGNWYYFHEQKYFFCS